MPAGDDLKTHALSNTDFYELLDLKPDFTPKDLSRAWRLTARKYHPDKVGAAHTDKFLQANIAYEIFLDPELRSLYDNARAARERKRLQHAQFEGKRRKLKEELEERERGVKRDFAEAGMAEDEETRLARELARLAEDGKRRRKEREEALRQEMNEEKANGTDAASPKGHDRDDTATPQPPPAEVPEIERTVKARFLRDDGGATLDAGSLKKLFSAMGTVENAFMLKDKTARVGPSREKRLVGNGCVVFKSVVGAHAAVSDWRAQQTRASKDDPWQLFQDVSWAEGREPAWVAQLGGSHASTTSSPASHASARPSHTNGTHDEPSSRANASQPAASLATPNSKFQTIFGNLSAASTPASIPGSAKHKSAPDPDADADGAHHGLKKAPSFASFSSAAATNGTPQPGSSRAGLGGAVGSPSLEELTMIRLRNAERRRAEAVKAEANANAEAEAKGEGSVFD